MSKWKCSECSVIYTDDKLLIAPSPFEPDDNITGCPTCRSVNSFEQVCDEEGCDKLAGCGWPSYSRRYRRTCAKHMRLGEEAGDAAPTGWTGGPKP